MLLPLLDDWITFTILISPFTITIYSPLAVYTTLYLLRFSVIVDFVHNDNQSRSYRWINIKSSIVCVSRLCIDEPLFDFEIGEDIKYNQITGAGILKRLFICSLEH